ncbi:MAG: nucleotidyltransferase family protein [Bacteroidales bacterium]|nr:nucleotidyltransferase family protein [Bacteroidales bacterium]
MKVMIFAAGLGTRLKPLTDNKPKALVELNGKPVLEHLILRLKKQGFNDLVINVHHFADQIESFLKKNNNFNANIEISDERKQLLETGGGLLKAKRFLESSEIFIIHNVDIFCDIDLNKLIEEHRKNDATATLVVQKRDSSRKLLFDETNALCQWKNYQTNETKEVRKANGKLQPWSFSGIHIINSSIFKFIIEKSKFSIIDLYLRLAEDHKISAFETKHNYWFDLGKPENILEAEKSLII